MYYGRSFLFPLMKPPHYECQNFIIVVFLLCKHSFNQVGSYITPRGAFRFCGTVGSSGAEPARQVAEWGLTPSRFGRLVAAHHTDSLPFVRSRGRLVRATSRKTRSTLRHSYAQFSEKQRNRRKKLALPNCRLVSWKCEAVACTASATWTQPPPKAKSPLWFEALYYSTYRSIYLGGHPWSMPCDRGLTTSARQFRSVTSAHPTSGHFF